MMLSNKPRGKSRMRVAVLVPVMAIVACGMSSGTFANAFDRLSAVEPGFGFFDGKSTQNLSNDETAASETVTNEGGNMSAGEEEVLKQVEEMPQFPGGEKAMIAFLIENLRYPDAAMKAKEQGYVVVRFVVDKTGKVVSPEIVKGVSPELDAEAVRVVSSMPAFIPGKVDGKPVSVYYTLPVSFKLQ